MHLSAGHEAKRCIGWSHSLAIECLLYTRAEILPSMAPSNRGSQEPDLQHL